MALDLDPLKRTARQTYRDLGAAYNRPLLPRAVRLEAWTLQKALYGLVRRLDEFEELLRKETR